MTREPPKIEFEAATAIGIGMTDKSYVPKGETPNYEAALNAMYDLRAAFEACLVGWYMKERFQMNEMMKHLERGVNKLGFDLVPRLTAAECHEQAIARRVAEDDR